MHAFCFHFSRFVIVAVDDCFLNPFHHVMIEKMLWTTSIYIFVDNPFD